MRDTGASAGAAVRLLVTASPEPSALPARLTSFIGRDVELTALAQQVERHRLVTVAGPGGVGKSRVALECLQRLPHRVVWVELGPVTDPRAVATAVATGLGLRQEPGRRLVDTLGEQLGREDVLLALDNVEHLVEEVAALVDAWLRAAPDLRVLTTSREPLQVEGEVTWRLAPLSSDESVTLFSTRAAQVRPGYQPGAAERAEIALLCRRLDDLPLAIELAAARLRVMTVAELGASLSDRFRLLTGGARGVLPRQSTLEASVAWSYDLLDGRAQSLLRQLSVFAHDLSAEAVTPELDVLAQLVDKSLVQVLDVDPRRFRLLEAVKDFARARVVELGESEAVRARHADLFLCLAEEAAPHLTGKDALAWLSRLDAEHHELEAALQWWHGADPVRFRRMVVALGLFWELRHPATGVRWLRLAVRSDGDDSVLWARVLWQSAHMGVYGDDLAATQRRAPEAVAAAALSGDPVTIARAATTATYCTAQHHPPTARLALEESVQLCREADDAWGAGDALKMASIACLTMGDDEGLALAVTALRSDAEHLGNAFFLAWCDALEGYVGLQRGHLEAARELLTRAAERCSEIGDPLTGWLTTAWLADLHLLAGRRDEARHLYVDILARAGARGGTMSTLNARVGAARMKREDGDADGAAQLLAPSAEALRQADPLWRSTFAAEYGRCLVIDGAPWLELALDAAEEIGNRGLMATAHHALGLLAVLRDDVSGAEAHLHKALALRVEVGHVPGVLESLDALGLLRDSGPLMAATSAARAARGLPRPPYEESAYTRHSDDHSVMSLEEAVAYATRRRGPRSRPAHGWASLTPTERAVVRLVAEGLNNVQIGERMYIGRGTVKTHLSHVFTKLGVATRAAVAAEVTRRDSGSLPPG